MFCVSKKKESHAGLKRHADRISFIFWWTVLLNQLFLLLYL